MSPFPSFFKLEFKWKVDLVLNKNNMLLNQIEG